MSGALVRQEELATRAATGEALGCEGLTPTTLKCHRLGEKTVVFWRWCCRACRRALREQITVIWNNVELTCAPFCSCCPTSKLTSYPFRLPHPHRPVPIMATIQSLPAEILYRILELRVHGRWPYLPHRRAALIATSMVARAWRRPSQYLLVTVVHITSYEKAAQFIAYGQSRAAPLSSTACPCTRSKP